MLFCSSVATVGSAMATGSTVTARRSSARWAQATIAPASNAENNAMEINCLAETLYILNSSLECFALKTMLVENPVSHPPADGQSLAPLLLCIPPPIHYHNADSIS